MMSMSPQVCCYPYKSQVRPLNFKNFLGEMCQNKERKKGLNSLLHSIEMSSLHNPEDCITWTHVDGKICFQDKPVFNLQLLVWFQISFVS